VIRRFGRERGFEQFGRAEGTHAQAITHGGAPVSTTRAVITSAAQSSLTTQIRYGGDLLQIATGRFRAAGESTVRNHIAACASGK
jgi:hypothetical protein